MICLSFGMRAKQHELGNKELELIPFDPLKLEKFSIVQNEQSPVNIRLYLRNISLTGLKDLTVTKVVLVNFWISFELLLLDEIFFNLITNFVEIPTQFHSGTVVLVI